MRTQLLSRVARLSLTIAGSIVLASTPAAAAHDSLECEPSESLQPLFGLLDSLTELAFLLGVSLGVLGFLVAGLLIIAPGEDWTRKGKQTVKYTFFGLILLLSANMVVDFLVNELGGVVCS